MKKKLLLTYTYKIVIVTMSLILTENLFSDLSELVLGFVSGLLFIETFYNNKTAYKHIAYLLSKRAEKTILFFYIALMSSFVFAFFVVVFIHVFYHTFDNGNTMSLLLIMIMSVIFGSVYAAKYIYENKSKFSGININAIIVLSLFFVSSTSLNATTFDDEWPIYVYGDATYYKTIYDGIAMVVQNTDYMQPFMEFIFMVSFLFGAYKIYAENVLGAFWSFSAGLGIVTMILWPTSTVHILDARTLYGYVQEDMTGSGDYAGYYKVDNVPFYLAAIPSFATLLKHGAIGIMTPAITPVDGSSMAASGYGTPMTLTDNMFEQSTFRYSRDLNYAAPKFGQALSHYVENCIVKEVLYIDKQKAFDILNPSGNQLEALNPAKYGITNTYIQGLNGGDITCGAFWNTYITANVTDVKNILFNDLANRNKKLKVDELAESMAYVAAIETNTTTPVAAIQNAMLNIATTGPIMSAFNSAGTGLSAIDLSNSVTSEQSLFAMMIDATGQFKWTMRVLPFLEFILFGIIIYLGLFTGIFAGFLGPQRGGKMLLNYAMGIVLFSFIDVGLALAHASILQFTNSRMSDMVIALGQNPFTATGITPYMMEMAFMTGVAGIAGVAIVFAVPAIIFKGDVANAAMGALSSIQNRYKGDQAGANLGNSVTTAASVHAAEAQAWEDYARRSLTNRGFTIPDGVMASQMYEQIAKEADQYGDLMGKNRYAKENYSSMSDYAKDRASAGMGKGMRDVASDLASGNALLSSINSDGDALSNFAHQIGTESAKSFQATAAQGKFSKENEDYSRDKQIDAAKVMANDALVKGVENARGLVESMAFNSDGSKGNATEFSEYAKGMANQARIQANKTMGAGREDLTHDEMQDVKRTEQANIKAMIAKGDALQQSFGSNLDNTLNGQSYDTMIRAQEMGNYSASTQAIKTAGGEDKFVALQKAGSSMRTAQSVASVNEAKRVTANGSLLDKDGNITDNTVESYSIAAGEQTESLLRKRKVLSDTEAGKSLANDIREVDRKKAGYNTKSDSEKKEIDDSITKSLIADGLLNADGSAKSGIELGRGLAGMGAMNFSASKAISHDGMTLSANIDGQGKTNITRADGGTAINTTESMESGSKEIYNNDTHSILTDGKFKSQVSAFQRAHFGEKPKSMKELGDWVESSDMAEATKNDFFGNLAATVSSYTGLDAETTAYVAGLGLGGYTLNKAVGNPIGKMGGKATDTLRSGINKGAEKLGFLDSSASDDISYTKNDTPHGTTNNSTNNTDNKSGDSHTQHDDSFVPKDKDNISNKGESVKDLDTKKANAKSGKFSWSATIDDIEDAASGQKSIKGKLAAGAAVLLGSVGAQASETLSNAMGVIEAVSPTGFVMGTNMGNSELTTAQLLKMGNGVTPQNLQAIQNVAQAENSGITAQNTALMANNMQELTSATRGGGYTGFTLQDSQGQNVVFTADKGAGHNLLINRQDTGIPYDAFRSTMQDGTMSTQFANAIASSNILDKDAYASTKDILNDLVFQNRMGNMNVAEANNMADTKSTMHHKEMMEATRKESGSNEADFL